MRPSEWVIDLALSDGAQRGIFCGGGLSQQPAPFSFHVGRGTAATGVNQL